MRKKVLLIGGGVTLLLLSILFGAFFAGPLMALAQGAQTTGASSAPAKVNPYCQQYLQALAQHLNIPLARLEQSQQAAKGDVLTQLVKDGKLTQAQADKIRQRLSSRITCGLPKGAHVKSALMRPLLKKYGNTLLGQVASGLHLSTTQLQADLRNGQTLTQIAKAQNISASQLHTIILNAVQNTLDQARQAKDITQNQENKVMQFLRNHPALVDRLLNRSFTKK